jgi:hypothetical protein
MNRSFRVSSALVSIVALSACASSVPVGGNDGGDVASDTSNPSDGGCTFMGDIFCGLGQTCQVGMCPGGTPLTCHCNADGSSECTGVCPQDSGGCQATGVPCMTGTECCTGLCWSEPGALTATCVDSIPDAGSDARVSDSGPACRAIGNTCTDFGLCCSGLQCTGFGAAEGRCYPPGTDTTHTCAVSGQPDCAAGQVCQTGTCPNGITPVTCLCHADGTLGECTGACPP